MIFFLTQLSLLRGYWKVVFRIQLSQNSIDAKLENSMNFSYKMCKYMKKRKEKRFWLLFINNEEKPLKDTFGRWLVKSDNFITMYLITIFGCYKWEK